MSVCVGSVQSAIPPRGRQDEGGVETQRRRSVGPCLSSCAQRELQNPPFTADRREKPLWGSTPGWDWRPHPTLSVSSRTENVFVVRGPCLRRWTRRLGSRNFLQATEESVTGCAKGREGPMTSTREPLVVTGRFRFRTGLEVPTSRGENSLRRPGDTGYTEEPEKVPGTRRREGAHGRYGSTDRGLRHGPDRLRQVPISTTDTVDCSGLWVNVDCHGTRVRGEPRTSGPLGVRDLSCTSE